MNYAPVLTALLPLRNFHPGFLRQAMESMLRQTSPHWHLLVVVEPSDLRAFASTLAEWLGDTRVQLVPNEGRGLPGAFNTGMRRAETAFVAILLGDDLWDARAVEVLQAAIRQAPHVDVFHSGRRVIDADGAPLSGIMNPIENLSLEGFIWKSQIKHLICWRRSMGLAVGGMDEALTTAGPDDYDFPWTMVDHGAVVQPIHECLYIYRVHVESVRHTTHYPRSVHLRDLRYILTKHGVDRKRIRRRLREAKRDYLRQCMYRNEVHRWLAEHFGVRARERWREPYPT